MGDVLVDRKAIVRSEVISLAVAIGLLLLLCFILPVMTQNTTHTWYRANNQYIIGPAVNGVLIYSALRMKKFYNIIGVVLLPSLCAVALGILGINAIFMLYMVPIIWVGNMAIVCSFRLVFHKILTNNTSRYIAAALLGITLKVAVIFIGFLILRDFGLFPNTVASTLYSMMGVMQFVTATFGAALAFVFFKSTTPKGLQKF
ncbi:MAG: hypothetical protein FWD32_00015 [Firmicutes bacterium]|nr:hypothetical protein [Bacillota bacterium]